MLKDYLTKQTDCVLWALLADISGVMGSRTQSKQSDEFWIAAATEITKEIDRRLFNDFDNDLEDDLLEDGYEPDPDDLVMHDCGIDEF